MPPQMALRKCCAGAGVFAFRYNDMCSARY